MALGDIWIYNLSDVTPPATTVIPSSGTYTSAQTVTLTANEPASIYYTLDGSTPTTNSTVYSGPISISSTKTLRYFAKDTAGNTETVKSATYNIVPVDALPPSGTVNINASAATTNSTSTMLTLSATDNSGTVSQMRFSNDGASWSSWETYATSKPWNLYNGTGTKTVYAQFRDATGNTVTVNDTILYEAAQTSTITTGQNVIIAPAPKVQLTFPTVSTTGNVTVTEQANPSPPSNFRVISGSSFQIVASGSFSYPVTVSLDYSDAALSDSRNESRVRLFHYEKGAWVDITTSVDTVNNKVYGVTNSFSPFMIGEPTTPPPTDTTTTAKVPVFNGSWLVSGVFAGLALLRRRKF